MEYAQSYLQPLDLTKVKKMVFVTARFEALHRWVDAPLEQFWLREYHRHLFNVKVAVSVEDGNREVEFFQLKDKLTKFLGLNFNKRKFDLSCEHIAEHLLMELNADYVEVNEDGENGAVVFTNNYSMKGSK
jgi:hypothetical protein